MDQSNVRKRHEWHILMFSPDDVDDFLSKGVSTDQIERLRLFYNTHIKEKSLDEVLSAIEQLLKDY